MGKLESGVLVRLNAFQCSQAPSEILLQHCMDISDVDMQQLDTSERDREREREVKTLDAELKITCSCLCV